VFHSDTPRILHQSSMASDHAQAIEGAAAAEDCAAHARAAHACHQTVADRDHVLLLACEYYLQAPASTSRVGSSGAWSPLQRDRDGAWGKYVQAQDMAAPHDEPHGHSSGVQPEGYRSMTIPNPCGGGAMPRHKVLPELPGSCCRSGAAAEQAQVDLRHFLREWGILDDEATALWPTAELLGLEDLNTQSEQAQTLRRYTQTLA